MGDDNLQDQNQKNANVFIYLYLSALFTAGHIDVSISFDIHVGNEQEWTLAY